ncbi:MAG: hypothetical protein AMXMBFR47_18950 [Planctomycetota bacterium]
MEQWEQSRITAVRSATGGIYPGPRRMAIDRRTREPRSKAAFSLAELLVVIGILSLLFAILLPPLQMARQQALQTRCSVNLQQVGRSLATVFYETNHYPLTDDGGAPIRYTWIDVLIQNRYLSESTSGRIPDRSVGYCPLDRLPDSLNSARNSNLIYPPDRNLRGVDYSYGIGVPLASGGWELRTPSTPGNRRFRDYDRNISGRVLAADAYDTSIYNLSGGALVTDVWNNPTQYDNTIAWGRHRTSHGGPGAANILYQDAHVSAVRYDANAARPVNTSLTFVWRPGESVNVNPNDRIDDDGYPNQAAPNFASTPQGNAIPDTLVPLWFTQNHRWTLISK